MTNQCPGVGGKVKDRGIQRQMDSDKKTNAAFNEDFSEVVSSYRKFIRPEAGK